MKKKVEGYITVYLSLMLGILIIVVMTVISAVRHQTVRYRAEMVMDAGLNSIFAEYNRQMLNRYGLLFIDDSYGGTGSVDYTKSHLLRYMNMNFDAGNTYGIGKDLTAMTADNAVLDAVSFASDDDGTVMRYQIVRYMKTKTGLSLISDSEFNPLDIESGLGQYDMYSEQRESVEGEIDELINDYNATLPEDEDPVGISNPADAVEKLSLSGAMYYAFGDGANLSVKVADIDTYISHRGYVNGHGLYSGQESPYSLSDKLLFDQYIFDKLGYYGEIKDSSRLDYQIEYMIAGKSGDMENLEEVVEKIFRIRYAVNMAYLYTDAGKQQEAMELALAATSVIGMPELVEPVKQSILLAWGYAESAKDMRILFDGNRLGAIKTSPDWNTPITQIVDFKAHLSEYHVPSSPSLAYKDFLYGFVAVKNDKEQNMRLMDIMEMDIRLTPGNTGFKMDNQIYQLSAQANMSSRYGYGCSVTRSYSYR